MHNSGRPKTCELILSCLGRPKPKSAEGSMQSSDFSSMNVMKGGLTSMFEEITIDVLEEKDVEEAVALIKRNMNSFEESDAVLSATFRRLNNLFSVYSRKGSKLLVARRNDEQSSLAACAGIGPLHGLPLSEGIGELRDLVVDEPFRGKGLGSKLLHRCIDQAKEFGYQRLYLETGRSMSTARKLFLRTGFRAVGDAAEQDLQDDMPCYFLLENLQGEGQSHS